MIDEELDRLRRDGPEPREVQRAINQMEASFYRRMERVGGFGGKADQLNAYCVRRRRPRLLRGGPRAIHVAQPCPTFSRPSVQWLPADRRVELVVEPEEKR